MRRYLRQTYQSDPWLVRVVRAVQLRFMKDDKVMETYYMLTDRR